ncbi:N-hydroxythioamide S-beta-glucosyltransferase [Sarracenia purpurea var. burkii]
MEEIVRRLKGNNLQFIWVLTESKLFIDPTREKDLVKTWCNQVEMLAHQTINWFCDALPVELNAERVEPQRADDWSAKVARSIHECQVYRGGERNLEIRNAKKWKGLARKRSVGRELGSVH